MKIARAYVATKAEIPRMVEATGLRPEYVKCGENPKDHISNPAWTMRKGELLGVFDLSAFGDKREAMAAGVAHIQKQGADVCEVETGHVAGKGVAMLDRALRIIHNRPRNMTPERAAEMARKAREKSREGWLPYDEARAIWGNRTKYPSPDQALMNMTGWPRTTVYRTFGKRKELELTLIEERKESRRKAKR